LRKQGGLNLPGRQHVAVDLLLLLEGGAQPGVVDWNGGLICHGLQEVEVAGVDVFGVGRIELT